MTDPRAEEKIQPQESKQAPDASIPIQISPELRSCPACGTKIPTADYFCPHCGRKIKNPPPSTSVWGQIKVYAFSILVPPFGIIPALRYLVQTDKKSKMIGMVIIILTLVSSTITIVYTMQFINSFNAELTKQLAPLQSGQY